MAGFASREALLDFLPGAGRAALPDPAAHRRRRSAGRPARAGGPDRRGARRPPRSSRAARCAGARRAVDGRDPGRDRGRAGHARRRSGRLPGPRTAALQGRRPQAEGARTDREPRGRVPHLTARPGTARLARRRQIRESTYPALFLPPDAPNPYPRRCDSRFCRPVASASSINAHAVTVTPTHAVIRVDPPVISFFTADVFVDYGTTTAYGSTAPGRPSISGTITARTSRSAA